MQRRSRMRIIFPMLSALILALASMTAVFAVGQSSDASAAAAEAQAASADDGNGNGDHCEDSDNKGHKDCKPENNPNPEDPPCDADHGHPAENSPECQDRDGDGVPDSRDRCPDEPGPAENDGCPEEEEEPCPDADGDGICDADDTEGPQGDESCADGVDNDGDGLIDDEDPDCNEGAQDGAFCDDGIDNDGDGATDAEDEDCQAETGTEGPQGDETCADGVDNDGDGLVDDEDPDCNEGAQDGAFCDDGIDNDGDGLTDDEDPDCAEADPCTAAAGDPGILTEDTLGQTIWDEGASALNPLTEDPDADGVITGPIYEGGNGTGAEPLTDEVACAGDLLIDGTVSPVDP